ncbi:hypothetical protein A2763_02965 [Candidatus Kaiserbacteria bacterium RIFCSPHIGHO2_01_FULL_54_36]|uniref:Uncharacterized protein n=1 Tax=Candidatus Kaiserbacteria bacterium RIFCSPHIGHO2_01_FULL_54_36 TaxID=1798482 RepID=A0A1F6CKU9_9BACT|nr:MAG: hypothetical protein A2763_02965 [Candidatus Kaiserbacteria bacterium RIFCSPHIGHO2_01_FULL_54_36]OGG75364.1 MAG: hypothetical protein A3A41_02220 [Candidatus Kaiserbacteria bacterium RIFCSPLOWO2_01_FULL_54_22]
MDLNPGEGQQREIYRLVRENNQMLHKMRRHAFWGGLIKFIVYALLLLAPLWLYMQYLAPVLDSTMQAVNQIRGTGAKAEAQFSGLEDAWQQFQENFSGFGSSSSSTSTR